MKLLKFTAPWCGQCKVLTKQLNGFDACEIVSYNVDDEETEEIIDKYGVKNLPLLILVNEDGEEVKRWAGLVNVGTLKNEISELANA